MQQNIPFASTIDSGDKRWQSSVGLAIIQHTQPEPRIVHPFIAFHTIMRIYVASILRSPIHVRCCTHQLECKVVDCAAKSRPPWLKAISSLPLSIAGIHCIWIRVSCAHSIRFIFQTSARFLFYSICLVCACGNVRKYDEWVHDQKVKNRRKNKNHKQNHTRI